MSCYLCTGDHPIYPNRSELKFMEEMFPDFSKSDNLCVSCFGRLDNLIDSANTNLPKKVKRASKKNRSRKLQLKRLSKHKPQLTQPIYIETRPMFERSYQVVQPVYIENNENQPLLDQKQMVQRSITIRNLTPEEMLQITKMGVGTVETGSLNELNALKSLKFITVTKANVHETINNVMQQSIISKF